jgi:hypothetical protein
VESFGKGTADTAGRAGDDHMSICEIHPGDGMRHRSGNTVFTVRCLSPVVPDGYGHVKGMRRSFRCSISQRRHR